MADPTNPAEATEHQVVIVGAGPAGMMTTAELTLTGIDVVAIERRTAPELDSPRSRGLHAPLAGQGLNLGVQDSVNQDVWLCVVGVCSRMIWGWSLRGGGPWWSVGGSQS